MQSLITLLRTKVAVAIFGALLIGSLGAYLGASSLSLRGGLLTSDGGASGGANIANTTTPGAISSVATASSSPTATPASAPTSTTGGAPPGGTGQTVDLHGTIGAINTAAGSFILNVNGSPVTVVTNGQTSFQGSSSSLQGLRSGWRAEVKGQTQGDGTFLAFVVDSDNGA